MKQFEMFGWNKKLPSMEYYELSLDGRPNWAKNGKEPFSITLSRIHHETKSSVEIATEFDDISQGYFWYRDITYSGLPFIEPGEVYKSLFVFQYEKDYREFIKRYLP